jgi:hypothetical protein
MTRFSREAELAYVQCRRCEEISIDFPPDPEQLRWIRIARIAVAKAIQLEAQKVVGNRKAQSSREA